MANFVGRLTIGSYEVWPNTRVDPMPWSVRSFEPWGYFEQNKELTYNQGTSVGALTSWDIRTAQVGQTNDILNSIKPLIGTVQLTAYDVEHRPTSTFVPSGAKVYVDNVQVATIGDVGFAQFQMHADDAHVIRVDMIDPYWGLPYIGTANITRTVTLDGVIQASINVPRARYEPWDFEINVASSTTGTYTPVIADIFADGSLIGQTNSFGYRKVSSLDDQEHSYVVVVRDTLIEPQENYRISVACTYGNSSVTAYFNGVPPRFEFSTLLQYIFDFAISPTARVSDVIETGSFFNTEPITITPVYVGDVARIDYTITSSSGVDSHAALTAPFVWNWTPSSSSTPDNVLLELVFTDSTGITGTYSESFVIHSKHVHTVHAVNNSTGSPVPLVGAIVSVDGSIVGATNASGNYNVVFNDTTSHTIRVSSYDPETGTDNQYIEHSVVASPDSTSTYDYVFVWTYHNLPPVVTIVDHGLGAVNRAYILEASVVDSDGSVALVSFYVDNVFVGSKATAPYVMPWTPLTTGAHALSVIGVDDQGASGSASATLQVSIAPTITSNAPSVMIIDTPVLVQAIVESPISIAGFTATWDNQVIGVSNPVQVGPISWRYDFTIGSSTSIHADLVLVATTTEGLSTTYTKNIFVAASYYPQVLITTKLSAPEYETPILVSADIFVDGAFQATTDITTGQVVITLPDNGPHRIEGHYVPDDLYVNTIFSGGYGTYTVLQDLVLVKQAEITEEPVLPEDIIPVYAGSAFIEPVFGDEKDSYFRILYGSDSGKGITPGRFWDTRSLPLPYSPLEPTVFKVIIDKSGINSLFRLNILREHPTEVPTTSTFDFVPESTEHIISVYLGRGLNVFDVLAYTPDGFKRINSTSYVATHYATLLWSYATTITRYMWSPLGVLHNDIYASTSTRLASPLIGFDAEFPTSANQARSARQRLVSAVMNNPTSTQSISVFSGSLFQQTPVLAKSVVTKNIDINQTWLRPLHSRTQTHNGYEMHIWQYDKQLARWAVLPKYIKNTSGLEQHNVATTQGTSGSAEWSSVTSTYSEELPIPQQSYWEVRIDTTVYHDLMAHKRNGTQVQYPGLWDSSEFPYFDQQVNWDVPNKTWDSGDVSNDIVLDGFIGINVTHETQSTRTQEIGTSVIDRCVETTAITNSYTPAFFNIE